SYLVLSSPSTTFSLLSCSIDHPELPSSPTRRSSDLPAAWRFLPPGGRWCRSQSDGGRPKCCGKLCRTVPSVLSLRHGQSMRSSRSEEHTSELQSRFDFVCRLVLEKKKRN